MKNGIPLLLIIRIIIIISNAGERIKMTIDDIIRSITLLPNFLYIIPE
jgi:hypothetical protein